MLGKSEIELPERNKASSPRVRYWFEFVASFVVYLALMEVYQAHNF
jgi:hypothetical protein